MQSRIRRLGYKGKLLKISSNQIRETSCSIYATRVVLVLSRKRTDYIFIKSAVEDKLPVMAEDTVTRIPRLLRDVIASQKLQEK